ncbi:MAG: tetratricopeptide repeat protein [Lentimicrobium sp.]|jgi:tetratricopeptide (TPR) repeat protein/DNA-binding CsgD family transcriptional regulator|nr:tetratricopeptide repeat protein [Lentimicrobium sp.]
MITSKLFPDLSIIKWFCLLFIIVSGFSARSNTSYTDSLKSTLVAKIADPGHIKSYLLLSNSYLSSYRYDSALFYLNKADDLAQKLDVHTYDFNTYTMFGKLFTQSGNYSLALQYQFKVLKLLDELTMKAYDTLDIEKKYATLYADFGSSYFYNENPSKGLDYYKKSYEIIKSLNQRYPGHPLEDELLILQINIGAAYIGMQDYDQALDYFRQALKMNENIKNKVYNGVLFNNIGIIFKEKDSCDEAFPYYEKALAIRKQLKDTSGMAQVLNNLGNCYQITGDYLQAIDCYKTAIDFSRKSKSLNSEMLAASSLSMAYEEIKDYKEALSMHQLFKQLHDSLINIEEIQKTAGLELQYIYEKQIKEKELEKEILLARKERKSLIYLIIAGVFLFSFLTAILLYRNQRIKMRQVKLVQQHLELEQQNLKLESQNLKLDLELRNKELATHVMYLVNKNEFIASITEKLLTIRPLLLPENKVWVQEIIREMKTNIDNTVWSEFEIRFQQVHEDFYKKLSEAYPDLTPNETKLCAFLRLNMTTKDISAITFQSIKSIQVARGRLRKKMGITRDDNLVTMLQQL